MGDDHWGGGGTMSQRSHIKAFISFTLHSFEDEHKEQVIASVHRALKRCSTLWILDYNEFNLDWQWFPFRWAFPRFECEQAKAIPVLGSDEDISPPRVRPLHTLPVSAGLHAASGVEKLGIGNKR
jgi:hypothetical protein